MLDRQQVLLAKALEAAGITLSVGSFDERLILQKSVYLMQMAGIHMGYRFRWYLRGPYSPEMTAGAFGILNEGEFGAKELEGWNLDEVSTKRAHELRPLFKREGESETEQARRLELVASALFLFKTEQAKPSDPEGTSAILKKNDKDYDADEVKTAVEELRAHGLV